MGGRQRKAAVLDRVAVLFAMAVLGRTLRSRKVTWAVDNLAALGCYVKGYSRRGDVASMVEDFWEMAAAGRMTPWMVCVKSKWNAADAPSRGGAPALRGEREDAALRALEAALRGEER